MSARTHLPGGLVTFLFTDIEGSTRLAQMLGPAYRVVLNEHRQVLRAAVSTGDGVELFTEGDSFFVAFPDAPAALRACVIAQRALAGHEWPGPHARPRVRMGLHTGYAEPVSGEYASPEVHRAARVAAAAHGGQVLCSAATATAVAHAMAAAMADATADASPGAARPAGVPAGPDAGPDRGDIRLDDLGLHRLRGFDGRERLFQLVAPGLDRHFPRPRTVDHSVHNLPAPATSFVGRAAERAELAGLVRSRRQVTMVGAAGAGKSRLAVEVARELVGEYPDGVWYVDLTGAGADHDAVGAAAAAALGVRPEPGRAVTGTVAEHAAHRRMLLVLDTCEARLAAAARLTGAVLAAGTGARVLVVSREPLGLPGELVWRTRPLATRPGVDGGPGDALALLLDRATAARGGHPVPAADVVHLDRVATALAGLPLAIELAAHRLRLLSPSQLAARIDDDLLAVVDAGHDEAADPGRSGSVADAGRDASPAGDRHASLAAALGSSYRDLQPTAARLLRRLSVFAGPVDLPAIEWLSGCDPLGPLAVLVDKSLVHAEPRTDAASYRVLAPIRAYAARELARAGEETTARDRHLGWCLRTVEHARQDAAGRPVTLSLYPLDPVADELRAGLGWAANGGSGRQGLLIAAGLDLWWRERGLAAEGRTWLGRLYARIDGGGERVPEGELASGYLACAAQAGAVGEYAEGLRFSERAERAARRGGEPALLARVLAERGGHLLDAGRAAQAERACRDALTWARDAEVDGDALPAVYTLARILWRRGALDEAASLLAGARPAEAARPADRGHRTVDLLLGLVALRRNDLVAAHDHLMVALRSRVAYGFRARAAEALAGMAVRCLAGGDPLTAARLVGAAQGARARLRLAGWDGIGGYWREQQAATREAAGDHAFDRAYADGFELPLDEAVALALTVEHPDLVAGSDRFSRSV